MTSALKWGGVDGFPKKPMIFLISCVSGIVTRGGGTQNFADVID